MVADLHGLTTIQDKKQLQHNIETLVLNELALLRGFMTEKEFNNIVFFRQSDVPMHTECQSILNNVTPLGLLKRAHAYKDKLQKDVMEDDINVGLFSYPMLMAADILLYQADLVPVGKDQKQQSKSPAISQVDLIRFTKATCLNYPSRIFPKKWRLYWELTGSENEQIIGKCHFYVRV